MSNTARKKLVETGMFCIILWLAGTRRAFAWKEASFQWAARRRSGVHATGDAMDAERFMTWASSNGVLAPGLELALLPSGQKGMRASSALDGGRPVITAPHKLVLETTTLSRAPPPYLPSSWAAPDAWASAPWYVRLALMLLYEKQRGASSPFLPWLRVLPTFEQFQACLPLHWTAAELDELHYDPLLDAIEKQRTEYESYFNTCAATTGATLEEFFWAIHCVRSRSFSGVYEGSVWEERATQAGFTTLLAAGALAVGAAEPSQVLNGVLAVGVTTIMRDFLVSNSGGLRRYVLCPVVDMMNHRGSYAATVSYEYFSNSFSATVSRPFNAGDEVCISYGERSNDQLLQFYGFTEVDNPNDQYEIRSLLELVDAALPGGVPHGRLAQLKTAGLLDAVRTGTATPTGFVDATRYAVRALVATDEEVKRAGGGAIGCSALANAAGSKAGLTGGQDLDARVDSVLATACMLELEALPSSFGADFAALKASQEAWEKKKKVSERFELALPFRLEKKRVLKSCRVSCSEIDSDRESSMTKDQPNI
jgi:hypothetical protein